MHSSTYCTRPHVNLQRHLDLQLRTCLHIYVQLRTSGGLAEVRSFEVSFLEEAVKLFAAAGALASLASYLVG